MKVLMRILLSGSMLWLWQAALLDSSAQAVEGDTGNVRSATDMQEKTVDELRLQEQLDQTLSKLDVLQNQFEQVNRRLQLLERGDDYTRDLNSAGIPIETFEVTAKEDASKFNLENFGKYPDFVQEALRISQEVLIEVQKELEDAPQEQTREALDERGTAALELSRVAQSLGEAQLKSGKKAAAELDALTERIEAASSQAGNVEEQLRDARQEIRRAQREVARGARQAIHKAEQALRKKGQVPEDRQHATSLKTGAQKDRVSFGSSTVVNAGETVPSLVVFSGEGEVFGEVEGDAVVMAGDLIVREGGRVGGDAVVLGGEIEVEEGGRIDGNQVYLPKGSLGPRLFEQLDKLDDGQGAFEVEEDPGLGDWIRSTLIWYLSLLAGGLLSLTFIPGRILSIARTLEERTQASGIMGVTTLIALTPLTVVLVVTLVGIPLIPLLYVGAMVCALVGATSLSLVVGQRLPFRNGPPKTPGGVFMWGLLVCILAAKLPYIGPILGISGVIVGFGAVIVSRFGDHDALV